MSSVPPADAHWQNAHIKFLAEPHVYLWNDRPVRVSSTGLLKHYFPDTFNGPEVAKTFYHNWKHNERKPYYHLIWYLLLVEGRDDEYVRDSIVRLWDANKKHSRDLGTEMHRQLDLTVRGRDVPKDDRMPELAMFQDWLPDFLKEGNWAIYASEMFLVKLDHEQKVAVWAGTADLVLRSTKNPDTFAVIDYKRSNPKKGTHIIGQETPNRFKNGMALPPFDMLENNDTGSYTAQVNIYAHMLFTDYGIDARDHLYVVQIHEELPKPHVYHAPRLDEAMETMTATQTADAVADARLADADGVSELYNF